MSDQRHSQAARAINVIHSFDLEVARNAQVADPLGGEIPGGALHHEALSLRVSPANSASPPSRTRLVWASRISRATARL